MREAMTAMTAVTMTATVALAAGGGAAAVQGAGEGHAAHGLRMGGQFEAPSGGGVLQAVTYDEELVPAGARIGVGQRVTNGTMVVSVAVEGVEPGHAFGVHVHTAPCTADPDDAGGHYQHRPGEEPWRANPRNEVWLDLTADASGRGAEEARHGWVFREGEARSVVLHEHATAVGGHHGGTPGDAGERVACFTVPFAGE
ncbi:superoxide dismutase family protein [Streptomyces sp. 6N223]|uniref:superoxide dismutase family protein n=1 Tax=Streptomyces sp. 6N223 TaxID=3457412 RepID=UPI003FD5F12C